MARYGWHLAALTLLTVGLPTQAAEESIVASVSTLEALDWMAGYWRFESPTSVSEECWLPATGGMLVGVHRTTRNGRAFFENLRIELRDDRIVYVAAPAGATVVEFALVEAAERRAVFANPEHDFPRRITYWREAELLHARAEGEGRDGPRVESWTWARTDLPAAGAE